MGRLRVTSVLVAVILLIGCVSCELHAQDSASAGRGSYYWFTGGVGEGSGGLSGSFMFSALGSAGLFTFRYTRTGELFDQPYDPSEWVEEYGVLRGLVVKKNNRTFAAFSAGIAYVRGVRRGKFIGNIGGSSWGDPEFERVTYQTVGLTGDAQVAYVPLPFLGIGLDIPVNLNTERSFLAFQVTMQLGILWQLHALDY